MGKTKIKEAILLSFLLIFPGTACLTPPSQTVKPKSPLVSVTPQTPGSSSVQTPASVTIPSSPSSSTNSETPKPPQLPKVLINGFNINLGNPGQSILLSGTNFISGKIKNIIFTNDINKEFLADIVKVTENELTFKVPTGSEFGVTLSSDASGKFISTKVSLLLENGEKVLVGDFKIIISASDTGSTVVISTGSSTSSSNTNNDPAPTTGNVTVNFNPAPPASVGTIAGNVFENTDTGGFAVAAASKALPNVKIRVLDKDNKEIGSGMSDANGAYSLNVPVGSDYHLEFTKDTFTPFNYYGVAPVVLKTITNIDEVYQSPASLGKGKVSGKTKNSNTSAALGSSIIKVYNKASHLIMTGLADASGTYLFDVPAVGGANYHYFEIIRPNYHIFRYYGVKVVNNETLSIDDIYQSENTIVTTTVKGNIKNVATKTVIDGAVVKIFKNGQLVMTTLANATGDYSFIVPVFQNIDYNIEIIKDTYIRYTYYGDANGIILQLAPNVISTVEQIYLTESVAGVGNLKGQLTSVTLADVVGSLVRLYNKDKILIMTGKVKADGTYDFVVPVGVDYYFDVVRPNYTKFIYYNLAVIAGINTIETIYLNLANVGVSNVTGTLRDSENVVINGSLVRIYNKLGQLIMTGFADANGIYNFAVPVGIDYYIRVIRTGYTDFYYYGVNIVLNQIYNVENLYLSLASLGKGTLSGKISLGNTVVRIYNKFGRLIMTTYAGADGSYNFIGVPVGSDYYVRIIRAGYSDFYYYGVNILSGQLYNIAEVFRLVLLANGVGSFSGVYLDAITNLPVANTVVRIYDNVTGFVIASGLTDINGFYKISVPLGFNYYYRYWYYTGGFSYSYYYTYYGLNFVNGFYYSNPIYYLAPTYQGKGDLSGSILDAVTTARPKGLTVNLKDTQGNTLQSAVTGDKGSYAFLGVDAGLYNVEVKGGAGYSDVTYSMFVIGNTAGNYKNSDRNIVVTPKLAANQTRVVLYWGYSPSDIDLHMTRPGQDPAVNHVYYDNRGSSTAVPFSTLDKDGFNGYGPEVITINNQQVGNYRFSVHDFSNQSATAGSPSTSLSYSGARIYVYQSTGLVKYFYVPYSATGGNLWTVFEMDGASGAITPVNTMSYVNSGFGVQSFGVKRNDGSLLRHLPSKHK